jgi:hypothetical protein
MPFPDFLVRLGAALLMGAIVGLERQWRQRTAGTRTNALVAAGPAAVALEKSRWLGAVTVAAAAEPYVNATSVMPTELSRGISPNKKAESIQPKLRHTPKTALRRYSEDRLVVHPRC